MCNGSICAFFKRQSCECAAEDDKCTVCCRKAKGQPCMPLRDDKEANVTGLRLHLLPGTPCGGLTGFCNYFNRCRTIDESGHIWAHFSLSVDALRDVGEWAGKNKGLAFLVILGIIVCFIVIVKIFAKTTPRTVDSHRRMIHQSNRDRKNSGQALCHR